MSTCPKLFITEFLVDYDAAIKIVAILSESDASQICTYGQTLGFFLSFAAATKNPKVKVIGGRNLISDADDFRFNLASEWELDPTEIIIPEDYPKKLMPINCAEKLKQPIYMTGSKLDKTTPLWMSKSGYEKIKSPKN